MNRLADNMKRFVENMRIDNVKFAEILQEEKLVLRKDKLFEVATPIYASVLINVNSGTSKTIMNDIEAPRNYKPKTNMHFVYNGEVCDDLKKFVFDAVENNGAFTIGICTSNPEEYKMLREDYESFKQNIEELGLGISVRVIDKEYGDHKAYLLTYRKK